MASVSSPYGAQPISDQTGVPRPLRIPFGIASGLASNIFRYQPVKMVPATGTLTPVTNPGGVPDAIFGIFDGVEYTPVGGLPTHSPFWPSGATYDTSNDMFVYITPMWIPGTRIMVQADGSVAQTALGSSFNFSNLSNGSTSTGLSTCTVSATDIAAGSQGQLTLVEFAPNINDAIGDAFTDLICVVSYPQIAWVGKTSTG